MIVRNFLGGAKGEQAEIFVTGVDHLEELPSGYTRLESIKGDGNSWIDTGVYITDNCKLELDFEQVSADHYDRGLYGAQPSAGSNQSFYGWHNNVHNDYTIIFRSAGNGTSSVVNVGKHSLIHTAGSGNWSINLDGTTTTGTYTDTLPTTLSITLLKLNGYSGAPSLDKISKAILTVDNTVKFNGIPCINDQNQVGMFDTVSQTFFGNSGTGEFIAGTKYVDLPLGYTQVEYIQSSGTQYIDTGISCSTITKVAVDRAYTSIGSGVFEASEGVCITGAGRLDFGIYRYNSSYSPYWVARLGNTSIGGTSGTVANTNRHKLVLDITAGSFSLDGTILGTGLSSAGAEDAHFYMFARNDNSATCYITGITYAYSIFVNGVEHQFIPCINSQNEAGMYDLESEQFFGNSGTGTFTAGPVIAEPKVTCVTPSGDVIEAEWVMHPSINPEWCGLPNWLQQVEYIQVPSNSTAPTIDTGMATTSDLVIEMDFQCESVSGSTTTPLFGGGSSAGAYTGNALGFMIQNYQGKFAGCYAGYRSEESSVVALDANKHHLLFNNTDQYFVLDDTTVRISQSSGNTFSGIGSNMYVCNGGGNCDYRGKFWEIKMWLRGQSLSRDFIPAYAKEAHIAYQGSTQTTCAVNEYGLYDLVNDRFYITSVTGTYTGGLDVPQYIYTEGYLISSLEEYGTYEVIAVTDSGTETTDVIVDAATMFEIEMGGIDPTTINGLTFYAPSKGYSLKGDVGTTTVDLSTMKKLEYFDCSYSGTAKNVTVPKGIYFMQLWGGQGGNSGGLGGYSYGAVKLAASTVLYLYTAGGNGNNFGGGGTCGGACTGGGGTDVRLGADSLYARVIAAGGGGGHSAGAGGVGGGLSGTNGGSASWGSGPGYGGTQTAGGGSGSGSSYYGSFGQGGPSGGVWGGAGGGGWYGGGGCCGDGSAYDDYGGGGGSGYVYNESTAANYPSGCLLDSTKYLINSATAAGNTAFVGTGGAQETGHSSNGYIRISKLR